MIRYTGTNFNAKIKKCECGRVATIVHAEVYWGDDIMNRNTGEKYLECDFKYFCKKHNPMRETAQLFGKRGL